MCCGTTAPHLVNEDGDVRGVGGKAHAKRQGRRLAHKLGNERLQLLMSHSGAWSSVNTTPGYTKLSTRAAACQSILIDDSRGRRGARALGFREAEIIVRAEVKVLVFLTGEASYEHVGEKAYLNVQFPSELCRSFNITRAPATLTREHSSGLVYEQMGRFQLSRMRRYRFRV